MRLEYNVNPIKRQPALEAAIGKPSVETLGVVAGMFFSFASA
jgi:hypothetical protein